MPLAVGGVDLVDLAEHALVVDVVQPGEELRLALGVGDGEVGLALGRILAQQAAVLGGSITVSPFSNLRWARPAANSCGSRPTWISGPILSRTIHSL
jgi:hypothetical protein